MKKNKLFKSNIVKLVRQFNYIIQKSKNEKAKNNSTNTICN